jgi:hypothetical protein
MYITRALIGRNPHDGTDLFSLGFVCHRLKDNEKKLLAFVPRDTLRLPKHSFSFDEILFLHRPKNLPLF